MNTSSPEGWAVLAQMIMVNGIRERRVITHSQLLIFHDFNKLFSYCRAKRVSTCRENVTLVKVENMNCTRKLEDIGYTKVDRYHIHCNEPRSNTIKICCLLVDGSKFFRLREISVVFSEDYEPVGLKKTPK